MIACFENHCPDCQHVHACSCEGNKPVVHERGLCPVCREDRKSGIPVSAPKPVHAPRIRFPGEELYLE